MKTLLRLIAMTMLVFFMSACGGSSGGGSDDDGGLTNSGDTVQTGTVTSVIDGVTQKWYTVKVDNAAGIVNSAKISKLADGDLTVYVQSYDNTQMNGENNLQFSFTFPGATITTGQVTGTLFFYNGDNDSGAMHLTPFTIELTTASGDETSAHLVGSFMLQATSVDSDTLIDVSVTFDVQADKTEVLGL